MDSAPGSYAVILTNNTRKTIPVGRRGQLDIEPGYYLYVGSAFGSGGLRARVGRHSRSDKPMRWHIDYVRSHMSFHEAWYSKRPTNQEHDWAGLLQAQPEFLPLKGIGCSDCNCETHLFFSSSSPDQHRFARLLGEPIQCWRDSLSNRHLS